MHGVLLVVKGGVSVVIVAECAEEENKRTEQGRDSHAIAVFTIEDYNLNAVQKSIIGVVCGSQHYGSVHQE